MAEIYCKRCLHHEELGRPLRSDEKCPACGSGVHRRKGQPPRPSTYFFKVLRAIVSWRGLAFLVAFSLMGMVPIGALAWAAIILLFLGGLKLALKSMQSSGGVIEFPEVSPEELLDKSALVPALAYVFLFVWLPPILVAFGVSGAFTLDPEEELTHSSAHDTAQSSSLSSPSPSSKHQAPSMASIPEAADLPGMLPGLSGDGQMSPEIAKALEQAGVPKDALKGNLDEKQLKKALEDAPTPTPHLKKKWDPSALGILAIVFGALLFLWAPMAIVLYLRTSSTLAMVWLPAGIRTMLNDPAGYIVLCAFVLPALALRFFVDAYTSTSLIAAPPFLFVKGAAVLLSWALCGLYVRSHARAFDLPVDDDDWTPHGAPAAAGSGAAPVVQGTLIR